jgi:hypothetical protein
MHKRYYLQDISIQDFQNLKSLHLNIMTALKKKQLLSLTCVQNWVLASLYFLLWQCWKTLPFARPSVSNQLPLMHSLLTYY